MAHDYGYIKRTEGADGDHVDAFIGDNPESQSVYVVDQRNADGTFDEHKVMLGFDDEASARAGYLANYSKGWKGLGDIRAMTMDEFKGGLKRATLLDQQQKPLRQAMIQIMRRKLLRQRLRRIPAMTLMHRAAKRKQRQSQAPKG
ncbi:hypothetical protein PCI56_00820 [Plesiomonas shigelloides subsp. oncorhynchi]|nr:hypothetical protein [Plesiomonas shigelloides]